MESHQHPGALESCTRFRPITKQSVVSTASFFKRQNILVVAMIIFDSNREIRLTISRREKDVKVSELGLGVGICARD